MVLWYFFVASKLPRSWFTFTTAVLILNLTHYFDETTWDMSALWKDPDATEKTLMMVSVCYTQYYRDHTTPARRRFLPVRVMDIMGLLRANRSPYLYPRYLAPAKNCLKQSHTSRLIQNVHPAHTPVTVWDYKIIHPSNIKCTLHSSLLPVREEHMRYKGESRADNALQWLN